MLAIINYGIGNLLSIKNMLKKIGYRDVTISSDPHDINDADKLILPGVGHFDYGMKKLNQSGVVEILNQRVLKDKIPILGICLGAQLLTKGSEEGDIPGLGWINARTVKFDQSKMPKAYKIPHMAWADVQCMNGSKLFMDMPDDPRFYFVHSYHMQSDDESLKAVTAEYGYEFVAGIEQNNILGMQFHPEKSHKYGMQLLRNFIKNY